MVDNRDRSFREIRMNAYRVALHLPTGACSIVVL